MAGTQVAPVPVSTATYEALKSRLQAKYGGVFEEMQPDGTFRLIVDIVPTTGGDHLSFYKKD